MDRQMDVFKIFPSLKYGDNELSCSWGKYCTEICSTRSVSRQEGS